jgi:hypothetical protein
LKLLTYLGLDVLVAGIEFTEMPFEEAQQIAVMKAFGLPDLGL